MNRERYNMLCNLTQKIAGELHDYGVLVNKSEMELSDFVAKIEEYQKKYPNFKIQYVMNDEVTINNVDVAYWGKERGEIPGTQWLCGPIETT